MRPIIIATRGSALALAQTNMVLAQCQAAWPAEKFEIKIIKTTGDKLQTVSLASANLNHGINPITLPDGSTQYIGQSQNQSSLTLGFIGEIKPRIR